MAYNTDKVRVTQVLVADNVSNLSSSASLPVSGTAFVNKTNAAVTSLGVSFASGAVMLEANQLGIYAAEGANKDTALDAFSVVNERSIYIAQGRNDSNDGSILPVRNYEKSMPIRRGDSIEFVGETCRNPRNSGWLIGGALGAINVSDETVYRLTIAFDGWRVDYLNGKNQPAVFPEFTTPDYTALGLSTANARDHIVQNMVYEINKMSRHWTGEEGEGMQPIIALALADADGSGAEGVAAGGSTITNLSNGTTTTLTLGYSADGQKITTPVTESMRYAFTDMIANLSEIAGTEVVIPTVINSTVGATVGYYAGYAAGSDPVTDKIIIMAVDDSDAYFDFVKLKKIRVRPGLTEGFNSSTVGNTEFSYADEGKGQGRALRLFYDSTAALNKYGSTHRDLDPEHIAYTTGIVETSDYNVYVIDHQNERTHSSGAINYQPYRTVVLIPCTDTATQNAFESIMIAFTERAGGTFAGIVETNALAQRLSLDTTAKIADFTVAYGNAYIVDGGAATVDAVVPAPAASQPGDKFALHVRDITMDVTVDFDTTNSNKFYGEGADYVIPAIGYYEFTYVDATTGFIISYSASI